MTNAKSFLALHPALGCGRFWETLIYMDSPAQRLQQQFEFLIEIDNLKKIQRQNVISDSSQREYSATRGIFFREQAGSPGVF